MQLKLSELLYGFFSCFITVSVLMHVGCESIKNMNLRNNCLDVSFVVIFYYLEGFFVVFNFQNFIFLSFYEIIAKISENV